MPLPESRHVGASCGCLSTLVVVLLLLAAVIDTSDFESS